MKLKNLIDEDFANYKLPSLFLGFPSCTFKCEREAGADFCQNSCLACQPTIEIPTEKVVNRYLANFISRAIVCGGLEPLDSFEDLLDLIRELRSRGCQDDFVIYTGYNKEEVEDKIQRLKEYPSIIMKFGRFRPNEEKHWDSLLGVYLASNNQFAERIS
jgi:organic radical activating enzyme